MKANEQDPSGMQPALGKFQTRLAELESTTARLYRQWTRLGFVRGSLFLASIILAVLGFMTYLGWALPWFVLAGIVLLTFLVVAFFHVGLEDRLFHQRLEIRFTRHSIAQIERDWKALGEAAVPDQARLSPVAQDLDLFGHASLMQLVCSAETPIGQEQLATWMIELPEANQIVDRQQAVKEMSKWPNHLDRLRLLGRLVTTQHSDPARFQQWSQSSRENVAGPAMVWFARIVAAFQLVILALFAVGLISFPAYATMGAGCLVVAFVTTVVISGRIHEIFNQVAAQQKDAGHYLNLFRLVNESRPTSDFLRQQQAALTAGHVTAMAAFHDLERRTWLANLRRNGLFYFVYLILQFFFLWDVHALVLLRNWREKFGSHVSAWFAAIGQWEAIASLAKLAADNPTWSFPAIEKVPKHRAVFSANQLGHPLLDDAERVCNDVEVGPPGSILLVTGSNMSGKSTMLRSIGLNIVLAQMGSVTCSSKLSMPPVELETSIRIADSLAEGVSYYFAELRRLKQVASSARQRQSDQERVLLYLLDEILQGTNSRERQIAVGKVLEHLVESEAIGAISTHDLELASNQHLSPAFVPVHFRETIVTDDSGKREMTFDYRMREGIATTTNALELLRIVGLK